MFYSARTLRDSIEAHNEERSCLDLHSGYVYSVIVNSSGEIHVHTTFGVFETCLREDEVKADEIKVSTIDETTIHLRAQIQDVFYACILQKDDFKELLGESYRESATIEELWAEWLDNECV